MDMNTLDVVNMQYHHDQAPSIPLSQQPKKPLSTGTWLPAEDARLRNAIMKHGTKWVSVASDVETRNGDQCAKRWKENLNPELDHGPWTTQEEQHLLEIVETYGRNWKFLASNFLESRAPLALKNRHALLMRRRFKRQDTGKGQHTTGAGANTVDAPAKCIANRPRGPVGSNTSPSPTSDFDLMGFLGGGSDADTAPNNMQGGEATRTKMTTSAWDERAAAVWHQHHVGGDGLELDSLLCNSSTVGGAGDAADKMAMISDSDTVGGWGRTVWAPDSRAGGQQQPVGHSPASSLASTNSTPDTPTDPTAIEYTVTCTRSRLKPLSDHLVAAAIFEISSRATQDDQVTMTLRLNNLN